MFWDKIAQLWHEKHIYFIKSYFFRVNVPIHTAIVKCPYLEKNGTKYGHFSGRVYKEDYEWFYANWFYFWTLVINKNFSNETKGHPIKMVSVKI